MDLEDSREFESSDQQHQQKERFKAGGSTSSRSKRKVSGFIQKITNKTGGPASSPSADGQEETVDGGSLLNTKTDEVLTSTPASPGDLLDQLPTFEVIDAGMCLQDRLYLFARADRHKEDW